MGDENAGGPGGAREQLIAALRRTMTQRGMNQAALAKAAGLSPAAVSNILKGKSVPGTDTLDMLAKALGITGQALRNLHVLRERADARVRRLDSYLAAAQRAAHEHPYPGCSRAPCRPWLRSTCASKPSEVPASPRPLQGRTAPRCRPRRCWRAGTRV
ncbi:helix-turn-helix domain-containing protein [Streptomyces chiangmaiensis]